MFLINIDVSPGHRPSWTLVIDIVFCSMKTEKTEISLQGTFFAILLLYKSTWLVSLTFLKVEKPNVKISIFFLLLSFFFFLTCNTQKLYGACKYYTYKQLLCNQAPSFSGLGWHTSYDWRATASKLSPKTHHILVRQLLGLPFTYYGHDTYKV